MKKLSEIKSKIKKHAPEVTLGALAIVSTAYAVFLKMNQPEQGRALSENCEVYRLAMNEEGKEELLSGDNMIWKFDNGTVIDLMYDPRC
jgi:hypothetical protein